MIKRNSLRTIHEIAAFEFATCLRARSTLLFFVAMFSLSFLKVSAFDEGVDGTAINSPFQIHYIVAEIFLLGIPIIAAIAGQSVYKEFQHNVFPLTFTAPISTREFLVGRFLASFLLLLLIFSGTSLGSFFGSQVRLVPPDRVVETHWLAYVRPFAVVVVPNVFFMSAIVFALAALVRKMIWVYFGVVVIFAANLIAAVLTRDSGTQLWTVILEPFGSLAFVEIAQRATVEERDHQLVPVTRLMVVNRLLWLSIGLSAIGLTLNRFRVRTKQSGRVGKQDFVKKHSSTKSLSILQSRQRMNSSIRLLPRFISQELRASVFTLSFAAIAFILVVLTVNTYRFLGASLGTDVQPITSNMILLGKGRIELFFLFTITIYAGQMVWRERESRIDCLYDTLPIPGWLPLVSKTVALMLLQAVLFVSLILCCIILQALKGHYDFEIGLYLKAIFGVEWVKSCLICALAVTMHTLVNHKYLAYFAIVLVYFGNQYLPQFGIDHHLLRYGTHPGFVYSDMDGFGNFLLPMLYFNAYWIAVACLLLVIANLFWIRGLESHLSARLRRARQRLRDGVWFVAGVNSVIIALLASFIFYNTNILNEFRSQRKGELLRAQYEQKFRQYKDNPQPRIVSIVANAEVNPKLRQLELSGRYRIVNKSTHVINEILVGVPPHALVGRLAIAGKTQPIHIDKSSGSQVFALIEPLNPNEEIPLDFEIKFRPLGFANYQADSHVVENGTYFDASFFPRIGYHAGYELKDEKMRREYNLESKQDVMPAPIQKDLLDHAVAADSDWIDFEITVTTSEDQIAVAPGSLLGEWTEDGKHHFRYRAESPMLCFFSVLSARYEVLRDRWKDVDLEIYYHPSHSFNLSEIMDSMKHSLAYYSESFGPYPNTHLRIVEVPRTHGAGKAFLGTIPISEGAGFTLRRRVHKSQDQHVPFFLTAHEVAHQWWAHQVVGADVHGALFLSESLAQYSALMVVKRRFGDLVVQHLLREERSRYFRGRNSSKNEFPLVDAQRQIWLNYHKGSQSLYALQSYIGEESINFALAAFVREHQFVGPPYPTAMTLVEKLRDVTPPELAYLIDDLFTSITLHDNRAVHATAHQRSDGKFEVRLQVDCRKYRGTQDVKEQPIPIDDMIEVGITDSSGRYQFLEMCRVTSQEQEVIVHVDEKPQKAGIDPRCLLIERNINDNLVDVQYR